MLWLCIQLPRLGREALAGTAPSASRSAPSEHAALERLGLWAQQWSSWVSLRAAEPAAPAMLWLEIGASLKLFRGHQALRAAIEAGLRELGYHYRLGIAPTPAAAAVLATAAAREAIETPAALRRRIDPLPLGALALPAGTRLALQAAGLQRIGELLALPEAAIARRFGPELGLYLQRLEGLAPEPLPALVAPSIYRSGCEFATEVRDTAALLFALQRLLLEFQGYLRARDRAVQQLVLRLGHARHAATRLTLGLSIPGREAAQFLALARERLARTALAAPVRSLSLEALEFTTPAVQQADFFSHAEEQAEQFQQLLDRFSARLGSAALQRLGLAADHRPEHAFARHDGVAAPAARPMPDGALAAHPAAPARPCWLLPVPCQIAPPSQLLSGPERIEGGWWDGADVQRDYYLARGEQDQYLWVFRALPDRAWYLHGLWS